MDWGSLGIALLLVGAVIFIIYAIWSMYRAKFSKKVFLYTLTTLFLLGGTLGSLSMLHWEFSFFCWSAGFFVFLLLLSVSKFVLWRRKGLIKKVGKEHV